MRILLNKSKMKVKQSVNNVIQTYINLFMYTLVRTALIPVFATKKHGCPIIFQGFGAKLL